MPMVSDEQKSGLVVLVGGAGFVGQALTETLIQQGYTVRIVSRRARDRLAKDFPEKIAYVQADSLDAEVVRTALTDAKAVIYLAGILDELHGQTFDWVHHQGAACVAQVAQQMKVPHFVHVSAIGADVNSEAAYARSKGLGEQAVLAAFPQAVIMRPSIIFGAKDSFFNRFALMAKFSPMLPLIGGGDTLFQPVFVGDVAAMIALAVAGETKKAVIYELGGDKIYSFKELMGILCAGLKIKRFLLPVPVAMAQPLAILLEAAVPLLGKAFPDAFLITRDQLKLLRHNNIVSQGAIDSRLTLQGAGLVPSPLDRIVPDFLRRRG